MPRRDLSDLDRPLSLLSEESEQASWQLIRCQPALHLRPFILGPYHGWIERMTQEVQRRELPRLMVPIIFNFGTPFDITGPTASGQATDWVSHQSFVAGLHDRYVVTAARGLSQCLQVNLTLLGAHRLGLDLAALSRQVVPAADAFGPAVETLLARLDQAVSWPRRFALLEEFILERFAADRTPQPELAGALMTLQQQHGRLRIDQLARHLDLSQKRLIGLFQAELGMAPKTIAQLLRFNRALRLLYQEQRPSLSEMALDCGYYDQAHFNRDFRAYCGFSPTELLERRDPHVDSVLN
jgi:AraC-like DNA-binding protein